MTAAAFDAVAADYDATFTKTHLARLLRLRVWQHLDRAFTPGQRVLELGCGTGEDAVWLASRGVAVHATDASEGMLGVAQRKAAGVPLVTFERQDASALSVSDQFDGAFANFGVLNCVADLHGLGSRLGVSLRPGSRFVAVVMPPFCLWETVWYALHGDLRRATRRWHSHSIALIGDAPLPVHYPSAAKLAKQLEPGFAVRHVEGLGTLLPPSYLSHLADRLPPWVARLDSRMSLGHLWADHYIAVLERR
jgi:SAM-dependent methyltransferase